MTFTFNLLTQKCYALIFVPECINAQSLVKLSPIILMIHVSC